MRFYISSWIGDGTPALNPFVYQGVDQSGSTVIDLRPDPTVAAGFALGRADVLPSGAIDLGDELDGRSAAVKSTVESRLGISLVTTSLRGIIVELLTTHARQDGTRWRPVVAGRDALEIYLGDQIFRMPIIAGGASHSENWNCGNGSLDCQLAWNQYAGNGQWGLVSSAAQLTGNVGENQARAEVDLDTVNMLVEATVSIITHSGTGVTAPNVTARKDTSTAQTFYAMMGLESGATNEHRLIKFVTGTETTLGTDATGVTAGETIGVRCDGSSILGRRNGATLIGPVTDTAISTGTRAGIRGHVNNASNNFSLDNWSAQDLSVAHTLTPSDTITLSDIATVSEVNDPSGGAGVSGVAYQYFFGHRSRRRRRKRRGH